MASSHTFIFNKSSVQFWEYGDASQPLLVMIHGFRGTHHGLQRIIDQLPGYHIIVPDLPGFGASEAFLEGEHSLTQYVAFLKAFLEHLNPNQPLVLVGHSFGSIITSHYAALSPASIHQLVLINPIGAPALEGPKAVMTRLAIFYYWLGRQLPAHASHWWLSAPPIVKIMSVAMAKSKDASMRRYIHQQHLAHFSSFASPQVVAEAFRTSVSQDVRQVAQKITTPTLLITGEQDDITPLNKQRELVAAMPNAVLKVIPSVGHLIHYETAEEAAQLIVDFIGAPITRS